MSKKSDPDSKVVKPDFTQELLQLGEKRSHYRTIFDLEYNKENGNL